MKKLSFVLAMILVIAFAGSAFAAQASYNVDSTTTTYAADGTTVLSTSGEENMNYYSSTTVVGKTYEDGSLSRLKAANKFNADGITNYPYEIYLPNEVNPAAYRIHSNYTKNTDACASCHATHTAVGNYLLQWYTAYETCMACHDGTVSSTYNVLDGRVGADADSAAPGGMFGLGGGSESNHNVTGAVEIAAAPGGTVVEDGHGDWEVEFGCESCHSPHGNGGNARLLAPDPNGYATKLATANLVGPVKSISSTNKNLDTTALAALTGIVAGTTGTISEAVYINGIFENVSVQGMTYYIAKPATQRDSLTQAVGPGYTFLKPGRESYFEITVDDVPEAWSSSAYGPTNWIIDNSTGVTRAIYLGAADLSGKVVKFFGIPTVKVAMNIDNYLNNGITDPTLAQQEKVVHGTGMNVFCGACHLDYNTASQEVYDLRADGKIGGAYKYDTGVYSKAHRHTVGTERTLTDVTKVLDYDFADGINTGAGDKGIFTCLTCHVAHGVSKDYWNRLLVVTNAVGPSGDAWTDAELVELAGSSVLKRMPNMGTCETCHNKEAANDGYFANSNLALTPTEANAPTAGVADGLFSLLDIERTWTVSGTTRTLSFPLSSGYVGSGACQSCHADYYAGWSTTYHSNMLFPVADADAALGGAGTLASHAAQEVKAAEIKALMAAGEATPLQRAAYGWFMTYSDPYSAYNDIVENGIYFVGRTDSFVNGGRYTRANVKFVIGSNVKTRVIFSDIRVGFENKFWVIEGLNGQYDLRNGGWADYNSKNNSLLGTNHTAKLRDLAISGNVVDMVYFNPALTLTAAELKSYTGNMLQNFTANSYQFNYNPARALKGDTSNIGDATDANPLAYYVGKDWNRDCGSCHATGTNLEPGLGSTSPTITQVKEYKIGCENCHGPAANHIKAPSDKNILNPGTELNVVQQAQLCGGCHNRGLNQVANMGGLADGTYTGATELQVAGTATKTNQTVSVGSREDAAIGFTPVALKKGYTLADFGYYATPAWDPQNKFGGIFWNTGDGARGEEGFPAFMGSKMYASRVVTCSTCHSSHGRTEEGAQLKAEAGALCASCHDQGMPIDKWVPKLGTSERHFDTRSHTFFGTPMSAVTNGSGYDKSKLLSVNGISTDPTTFKAGTPGTFTNIKAWGWGQASDTE